VTADQGKTSGAALVFGGVFNSLMPSSFSFGKLVEEFLKVTDPDERPATNLEQGNLLAQQLIELGTRDA
jgi:hypothetical protein